jgi:NAD(P)-dependent dehydrogenase (short-subunit alcohol dehydrogenase family)
MGTRSLEAGAAALETETLAGVSNVVPMELDVASDASVASFADAVKLAYGAVGILVNNAGIIGEETFGTPLLESRIEDFTRAFDVNTLGAIRMMQALVPDMVAAGYGRVVNISSGMGQLSDMGSGTSPYRLSKSALNAATRVLANEVEGSGVFVVCTCPGFVDTDMTNHRGHIKPSEAAENIAYLATLPSDAADHSGGFFRNKKRIDW